MSEALSGTLCRIALKREHQAPMTEVDEATVTDLGLEGNVQESHYRRITLISKEQWEESLKEVGADLPWHTRRANLLVEGIPRLGDLIGKTVTVGEATLRINGETKPCSRMDGYCEGLKNALKPQVRAGVFGSVIEGGAIRTGDAVEVSID